MTTAERDHDPAGWHGHCVHRLTDGTLCMRWTWFAWVASDRRSKRMEPDKDRPHQHREVMA